ncbi:hypothetical protein PRIPAC_87056 [Pristionchus pacificus]|uniref:G protein-coupled receptor n=1 Tax=Pristionchus pacificus TaxID=54126 RepID=A0A2A6BS32_PRIPA|nr:hypothetical protein PRIPAC_87056 [Pristionchus pacificus]|eukprot:PDM68688.1 G protein-coupled receptor [Pristionchus pacificus]
MATLVTVLERLEQVNTVTGITFNLLLLYAIRRFSAINLGTYKYLLTCFTTADLFLVIMHVMMHPRAILVGCTHAVVTDTVFEHRSVTASFVAFQSVPFTLLGIHFLYRYWSVRYPHLIELFSNKKFIALLIAITVGSLLSWFLMSYYGTTGTEDNIARRTVVDAYEQKYGKRIENAWIVLDHWRDDQFNLILFMTVLVTNVMMISSLILACLLAILTFHHIKKADKMSAQITILQRKLLIALCAQAFVPSIFVYIPYVLTINIPFFRIPIYFFHDITIPLFTCFPVWDAAIMILLITDYRRGLMGMIRKNKVQEESVFQVTSTSGAENSYSHEDICLELVADGFTNIAAGVSGATTGLLLNVMLLYAIIRYSGIKLGTYKHLLTIFTVSNLFLVVLHEVVHPRAILVGCTHGGTTDTVFDDRRITALNAGFQSVPFALLGIHFLYRYWSVRKPHLIQLFSTPKFVTLLISITAGQLMSWYLMSIYGTTGQEKDDAKRELQEEYERKYGKGIENAWVILDHWRDNRLNPTLVFMVMCLNVMMISALFTAASLAVLTFNHLNLTSKISTKSGRLQRKLLIALCAQASVPSLFVYTPYLLVMNIPFFRIPITIVHDASVPFSTCFPAWDAAVIIILISDYRRGLMRMVGMSMETAKVLKLQQQLQKPSAIATISES